MGVELKSVVPWGRLLSEYMGMFNLMEADLQRSILDVGGGPASFNAEATAKGAKVVSIDPIYEFSSEQIEQRVNDTYDVMLSEVQRNEHLFVWEMFKTPQELGECRLKAMRGFLADFPTGLEQGRYLAGGLPELPFADKQFDLALCSNFLFLYSDKLSTEFHLQSLREMSRVAAEVRIFPLRDMANQPSEHVDAVTSSLLAEGYSVQRASVPYEFRHGCHHMLQITRN
jgi:SAM-dependent methyltransferase